MTPEAKAAKLAYQRQWRKNNPDKVRAANDRYWQRKADEMKLEQQKNK